jgi:hypothetical protein
VCGGVGVLCESVGAVEEEEEEEEEKKRKEKKKRKKIVKKRKNTKITCKIKIYIYITNTHKDCDLLQDRSILLSGKMSCDKQIPQLF